MAHATALALYSQHMAFTVWSYPTRILFGAGSAAESGREAKNFVSRRVLLVTDEGVVRAGLARAVEASLSESGL